MLGLIIKILQYVPPLINSVVKLWGFLEERRKKAEILHRTIEAGKKVVPLAASTLAIVATGWKLWDRWKQKPPPDDENELKGHLNGSEEDRPP